MRNDLEAGLSSNKLFGVSSNPMPHASVRFLRPTHRTDWTGNVPRAHAAEVECPVDLLYQEPVPTLGQLQQERVSTPSKRRRDRCVAEGRVVNTEFDDRRPLEEHSV